MSVEARYVVMRNNVEVETFMDKKAADEHDKMLDIADNIAVMLDESSISLSDNDKEQLSIYFAKQREELLIALQAKKPKAAKKEKVEDEVKVELDSKIELKEVS